ncbi:MAG: PqqD family protein [Firmicutes bacterium]|nr:PqqD family protein [Bacillota bacterium]
MASLNASGLYLWELLAQPCTFRHLVQEVSRQYAVAEDVSRADVAEFLDLALGKGVVLRC